MCCPQYQVAFLPHDISKPIYGERSKLGSITLISNQHVSVNHNLIVYTDKSDYKGFLFLM
jgi:hypothetical protein